MFPYQPSQGLDAPASHACGVCSKGRKICLRDPESFSGMSNTITRGQGGPYVSPADVLETVREAGAEAVGNARSAGRLILPISGGTDRTPEWKTSLDSREQELGPQGLTGHWSLMNAPPGGAGLANSAEWDSPTERWEVKTLFVRTYCMHEGWMKTGREAAHEIHDVSRNIAVVSKAQVMRD